MEPWEALDVDDSDLPSLLRPCKRQHRAVPLPHTTITSQPHSIPQRSGSTPVSPTQSQTLDSDRSLQSQHSIRHFNDDPPPTTSSRIIPGPAGAVQAAMICRTRDNRNSSGPAGEGPPVPTQEYIRRAVEHGSGYDDYDDFKCSPWLCALEFLSPDGMVDGILPVTPLGSISGCRNTGRVDKVVAVIKSCTSNGLGDIMVTLKDPTGTIGASIHRKVLTDGEFGKDISVGSVLILQKVAVFVPSRSAHYLNITLGNMVKVIWKECGPPSKQNHCAFGVKHSVPGAEWRGETGMPKKAFSLEVERTEGFVEEISHYASMSGIAHANRQIDEENVATGSIRSSEDTSKTHIGALGKGPLLVSQDAVENIIKNAAKAGNAANAPRWNEDGQLSSMQLDGIAENLVGNHSSPEIQKIDGVQKERPPLMSRASLPQWTDEQLNELFAANYEDDNAFF